MRCRLRPHRSQANRIAGCIPVAAPSLVVEPSAITPPRDSRRSTRSALAIKNSDRGRARRCATALIEVTIRDATRTFVSSRRQPRDLFALGVGCHRRGLPVRRANLLCTFARAIGFASVRCDARPLIPRTPVTVKRGCRARVPARRGRRRTVHSYGSLQFEHHEDHHGTPWRRFHCAM